MHTGSLERTRKAEELLGAYVFLSCSVTPLDSKDELVLNYRKTVYLKTSSKTEQNFQYE